VFTSLISPLLTPEVLASKVVSIVLMLDLSSPHTLWTTFDVTLKTLNEIVRELKSKKPEAYEQLVASAWRRVGREHVVRMQVSTSFVRLYLILLEVYLSLLNGALSASGILSFATEQRCDR